MEAVLLLELDLHKKGWILCIIKKKKKKKHIHKEAVWGKKKGILGSRWLTAASEQPDRFKLAVKPQFGLGRGGEAFSRVRDTCQTRLAPGRG